MGSEDEVRTSHAYSLIYCPVSPLMHDGPMMDAYFEMGSLDLPIMVLPMPVPGMTGPASLFGNICIANAEALSSIIAYPSRASRTPHDLQQRHRHNRHAERRVHGQAHRRWD